MSRDVTISNRSGCTYRRRFPEEYSHVNLPGVRIFLSVRQVIDSILNTAP